MTHEPRSATWSIVLAAGEGTRLRELTLDADGTPIPKQFCSLAGGPTLLEQTLERAAAISAPERTLVIVAAAHRRLWESLPGLARLPRENVIVQPANRGTAAGVLLPLLEVLERDAQARVAFLPSDHYVADEPAFEHAIERALACLEHSAGEPVLVGIAPDGPEQEYGWIETGPGVRPGLAPVAAFAEKPAASEARRLFRSGALWSSFVFSAGAEMLVRRIERSLPELVRELRACRSSFARLERAYAALPPADFSRHVLEADPRGLLVVAAPPCGWTDLGTPSRVASCLRSLERERPSAHRGSTPNLRAALVNLRTSLLRAAGMVPAVG